MPLRLAQGQVPSAVDLDFHAAVQGAAFSGFVVGHRMTFAGPGHENKIAAWHAGADQVIGHRVGAFFREFLVVPACKKPIGPPAPPLAV